jgi:hypothetical protein
MPRAAWWIAVGVLTLPACRSGKPGKVVVVVPPGLESVLRDVTRPLTRLSPPVAVELRVAAIDARAIDGADVVIAHSSAGLSEVAPLLGGTRVSFSCDDEVVLVGTAAAKAAPVAAAITAADVLLVADPRGEGEAAEAALGRAGLRASSAKKLRYVGTAEEALQRLDDRSVALVSRSDLRRLPQAVTVVASGFDGARGCPTAAALAAAPHPDAARRVLALLAPQARAGQTMALQEE